MRTGLKKTHDIKYRYKVERSSYIMNHDDCVVHLRMIAPDGYVEYLSYTIPKGDRIFCKQIDQQELLKMQQKLDAYWRKKQKESLINLSKLK